MAIVPSGGQEGFVCNVVAKAALRLQYDAYYQTYGQIRELLLEEAARERPDNAPFIKRVISDCASLLVLPVVVSAATLSRSNLDIDSRLALCVRFIRSVKAWLR